MAIYRYQAKGKTFYAVGEGNLNPIQGSVTISVGSRAGWSNDSNVSRISSLLEGLAWKSDPKEKNENPEKEEMPKKGSIASIADIIRKLSESLK